MQGIHRGRSSQRSINIDTKKDDGLQPNVLPMSQPECVRRCCGDASDCERMQPNLMRKSGIYYYFMVTEGCGMSAVTQA